MSAVVTAIVTSALVSGVVTAFLSYHLDRKLERFRAELEETARAGQELAVQKVAVYPEIVELIYRIRNLSRAVADGDAGADALAELRTRIGELEAALYRFRLLLERDDFFTPIHEYKNELRLFNQFAADLAAHRERADADATERTSDRVQELYAEIDRSHEEIIDALKVLVGGRPPGSRG